MVIDQGSMLDRIDYNVERMATDVKEADKELKVASGYQKKSVKRKIMLLLVILIAGVFILLSLKLSRKGNSAPPPPVAPETLNPPTSPDGLHLMLRRRRRESVPLSLIRNWQRRKRRLWRPLDGGQAAL